MKIKCKIYVFLFLLLGQHAFASMQLKIVASDRFQKGRGHQRMENVLSAFKFVMSEVYGIDLKLELQEDVEYINEITRERLPAHYEIIANSWSLYRYYYLAKKSYEYSKTHDNLVMVIGYFEQTLIQSTPSGQAAHVFPRQLYVDDAIHIHPLATVACLVHEFLHALGMIHTAPVDDIMSEKSKIIDQWKVLDKLPRRTLVRISNQELTNLKASLMQAKQKYFENTIASDPLVLHNSKTWEKVAQGNWLHPSLDCSFLAAGDMQEFVANDAVTNVASTVFSYYRDYVWTVLLLEDDFEHADACEAYMASIDWKHEHHKVEDLSVGLWANVRVMRNKMHGMSDSRKTEFLRRLEKKILQLDRKFKDMNS